MSGPSLSVVCFPCVICQYVYDDDVIVVVFRLCYFVVSLSQFVSCVHDNVEVVVVVVEVVVVEDFGDSFSNVGWADRVGVGVVEDVGVEGGGGGDGRSRSGGDCHQ